MATEVGQLIARLTADASQFKAELERAAGHAEASGGRIASAFHATATALTAIGAAAAGTVTALFALSNSVTKNGEELLMMSQRTGLSVEKLTALAFAAGLSNIDMMELGFALKFLANHMQLAAEGGNDQEAMFKALRIEVKDFHGQLRPLDEVMLELADRFSRMTDATQRSALAVDLFGRSGVNMIPFLQQGTAEIKSQTEEAKRLGVVWTTDMAVASDQFQDNLKRITSAAEGLRNMIGIQLLHVFAPLVEQTLQWAQANRAVIASGLKEWTMVLAEGLVRVGELAAGIARSMFAVAQTVASFFTLWAAAWATIVHGLGLAITKSDEFNKIMSELRVALVNSGLDLAAKAADNLTKSYGMLAKAVDPTRSAIGELSVGLDQNAHVLDFLAQKTNQQTFEYKKLATAAKQATAGIEEASGASKEAAAESTGRSIGQLGPAADLPIASGQPIILSGVSTTDQAALEQRLADIQKERNLLQSRLTPENWLGTIGAAWFPQQGLVNLRQLNFAENQARGMIMNITINGAALATEDGISGAIRGLVIPELRRLGIA